MCITWDLRGVDLEYLKSRQNYIDSLSSKNSFIPLSIELDVCACIHSIPCIYSWLRQSAQLTIHTAGKIYILPISAREKESEEWHF